MAALKIATQIDLIVVSAAGTNADTVRDLFLEYGELLGFNTCFGGFEQEPVNLPGEYAPPRGCLLLATRGGEPAGCVGVRPVDERACEIKRLFVRAPFRRKGLRRALAGDAILRARGMITGAPASTRCRR